MNPEAASESEPGDLAWSILEGNFYNVDIPPLKEKLEEFEPETRSTWKRPEVADRLIVAETVRLAITASQPELFSSLDEQSQEEFNKDVASSVFASASYSTEQMDTVAEVVADFETRDIPALKTLTELLLSSSVTLEAGKDISAVSRTAVLYILAKQQGRSSQLPKAVYNNG